MRRMVEGVVRRLGGKGDEADGGRGGEAVGWKGWCCWKIV